MHDNKSKPTMSNQKIKYLQQCRNIVKEIHDFGINDYMAQQIIKLLSLELEDRNMLESICRIIDHHGDSMEDEKPDLIL
jgi:hypothetical protein